MNYHDDWIGVKYAQELWAKMAGPQPAPTIWSRLCKFILRIKYWLGSW